MKLTKIKSGFYNWRYELVALVVGALVLILEIAGARIIAPQFGASTYVWTAVIGVILAALSGGYWFGGRLADKGASQKVLSIILLCAALALSVSLIFQNVIFDVAKNLPGGLRVQALFASLLVFAPASFCMGAVSPYLLKLKLSSLSKAGSTAGNLYAAGTVGSILGTFLSGYWLISTFGSRQVAWGVVVALFILALVVYFDGLYLKQVLVIFVVPFSLLALLNAFSTQTNVVYSGDGQYSHYTVLDIPSGDKTVRHLLTDGIGSQSGIILGQNKLLAFGYINRFNDIVNGYKAEIETKRILVVGGGAFTFPDYLMKNDAEILVDVIEIDPKAYELGKTYFGVSENPRMKVFFEDGRTFINNSSQKYDLIFMDAFMSLTPPFQLTTSETVTGLKKLLNEDGVVVSNVISSVYGDKNKFLEAEFATYSEHFDFVSAYQVNPGANGYERQNLLLIAGNSQAAVRAASQELQNVSVQIFPKKGLVLTDNFAPVEQMTAGN